MRIGNLILAASAAVALATPALATGLDGVSSDGMGGGSFRGVPSGPVNVAHRPQLTLQDRYDIRVLALKHKLQAWTAQDGGQLSLTHQVSLQRELDDVNHWFGVKVAHD
jgi:hypothetical protein